MKMSKNPLPTAAMIQQLYYPPNQTLVVKLQFMSLPTLCIASLPPEIVSPHFVAHLYFRSMERLGHFGKGINELPIA